MAEPHSEDGPGISEEHGPTESGTALSASGDVWSPLCQVCTVMLSACSADGQLIEGAEGVHHSTAESVLQSVEQRCWICYRGFKDVINSGLEFQPWSYKVKYFSLAIICEDPKQRGACQLLQLQKVPEETCRSYSDCNNLSALSTGHKDVLRQAAKWLASCVESHAICSSSQSRNTVFLPPRLLRIEQDTIRLIDTETAAAPPNGGYVTLSYCWGPNPTHLRLSANNIDRLRKGISFSELPKTFIDTIEVCTYLGFRLLWIDSLTILQDGTGHEEDWQKHVSLMGTIYSNASLSVAADRAVDTDAGCFADRDPNLVRPCLVSAEVAGVPTILHVYSLWDALYSVSPLARRGWALQERSLSPRVLHFTDGQIAWECACLCACETFPYGIPDSMERRTIRLNRAGRWDDDCWRDIIHLYSRTQLTFPGDKLPALAGIAGLACDSLATKYVAGMPESRLLEFLLWTPEGFEDVPGPNPHPYRAPSWSWLSIDRPVFVGYLGEDSNINVAEIYGLQLDYVDTSNPYGQLKGGHLDLVAASLILASVDAAPGNQKRGHFSQDTKALLGQSDACILSFDIPWSGWSASSLKLVIIRFHWATYHFGGGQYYRLDGLILTPTTSAPHLWTRIGTWWASWTRTTPREEVLAAIETLPRATFRII